MLKPATQTNGCGIAAADGHIGHVSDVLFDDQTWMVRWIVVECGSWLMRRNVLLPPLALGHLDLVAREFSVRLSKKHISDSPNIDTDKSVTRHMEGSVYNHYGWTPYWNTGFYFGGGGYLGGALGAPYLMPTDAAVKTDQGDPDDPHLRSANTVVGYHIEATDGVIGHVEDLLLEDADWSLRYLIVNTKNWWPGKKVMILPSSIKHIDWSDRLVLIDVDRNKVQNSPAFSDFSGVDRSFDQAIDRHYHDVIPTGLTEVRRPPF
jgi:hypothetical protein